MDYLWDIMVSFIVDKQSIFFPQLFSGIWTENMTSKKINVSWQSWSPWDGHPDEQLHSRPSSTQTRACLAPGHPWYWTHIPELPSPVQSFEVDPRAWCAGSCQICVSLWGHCNKVVKLAWLTPPEQLDGMGHQCTASGRLPVLGASFLWRALVKREGELSWAANSGLRGSGCFPLFGFAPRTSTSLFLCLPGCVSGSFPAIGLEKSYHFQLIMQILPTISRRKWLSDIVRTDSSLSFHVSKLSNAKFSILYDISLVRDWKRKSWLIKPLRISTQRSPQFLLWKDKLHVLDCLTCCWYLYCSLLCCATSSLNWPPSILSEESEFLLISETPWKPQMKALDEFILMVLFVSLLKRDHFLVNET